MATLSLGAPSSRGTAANTRLSPTPQGKDSDMLKQMIQRATSPQPSPPPQPQPPAQLRSPPQEMMGPRLSRATNQRQRVQASPQPPHSSPPPPPAGSRKAYAATPGKGTTRRQAASAGSASRKSPVGFGSQSTRFSTAGTYPRALRPGTCIAATYTYKDEDRRRGPGMHEIPLDETLRSATKMTRKNTEPEWSRQASHPHRMRLGVSTVHQRLKKKREKEARQLGPGTYVARSFTEDSYGHIPMSLSRPGARLAPPDEQRLRLPDATTYADAHDKFDAYVRSRKSPSRVGVMEGAAQRAALQRAGGTDIPPNMYADAFAAPLMKAAVTERGPYDTSSGKRFAVRKKSYDLVPGQYGVVDLAPLSSSPRPRTAEFSKMQRFGAKTGMRLEGQLAGLGEDSLGPGHYTSDLAQTYPPPHGPQRRRKHGPAFGSTTNRKTFFDDVIRRSARTPTDPAEYNPPVPGSQHAAGRYRQTYGSCLKSTVGRFDFKGHSYEFARERLAASRR
ncbi:hypothetical protein PTSG_09739 [Salpingoeca rosetta]|uniref:Uncharacterized protein n=1 Tax=Salpingoeca rosetta (strain ATCC 50818 / BSB-021) TaxID=946362 RepID=F2UNX1_SALR5|nr:uncharacterized protein PTSG_09739 [Salpingoeca rosetta]EGD79326.1 hypothetical protein PTSG_09739 [Salpingoeca rosetta]|eukprot:XP_004989095.1 hypothetical protein PTSG_09739 [Salpingoeca rosetta]